MGTAKASLVMKEVVILAGSILMMGTNDISRAGLSRGTRQDGIACSVHVMISCRRKIASMASQAGRRLSPFNNLATKMVVDTFRCKI